MRSIRSLVTGCLFLGFLVAPIQLLAQANAAQETQAASPEVAQETRAEAAADPRYRSPHATMMTFIDAMNLSAKRRQQNDAKGSQEAIAEAVATFDLSEVNSERGPQLAARLLGILNRLGWYQPWYLWHEAEIRGATRQVYFPHPRFEALVVDIDFNRTTNAIVLVREADGNWKFSAQTVVGIDELYLALERLPIKVGLDERELSSELWLRARMPDTLKGHRLLTLESWQWLTLGVFILFGLILDRSFRLALSAFASRAMRAQGAKPKAELMRIAVRPAGLLVMATFWLYAVKLLGLPDLAYTVVQSAARVFAVLAATWFAWRFLDVVIEALLHKALATSTKFDDVLLPLVRTAARILIVIAALIYGGLSLNFDLTPLLASLTIGGVGFAFAAKDTLENFFGSATVLVDQPFEIDDWVKIGDVEGTVEKIGFRSTRIRTFYDSLVSIPNANLVRASVDNYGRRQYRRWSTHLALEYATDPDQLEQFVAEIRETILAHPQTRKDYFNVFVHQFSASSVDVLIYVFFETPTWTDELAAREELILRLLRLARSRQMAFAFPTRTVHLAPTYERVDAMRLTARDGE